MGRRRGRAIVLAPAVVSGDREGVLVHTLGAVTITATGTGGGGVAATLWINGSSGSDSNTIAQVRAGAGSVAWATIGRAAWGSATRSSPNAGQAAVAGDVIAIAAGTYNHTGATGNTDEKNPLYQTVNEGTVGNPIMFIPSGGVVTIQSTVWSGPAIGAYQKDYVIWDGVTPGGFYIDEDDVNSRADTGPAVMIETTGSELRHIEINGAAKAFGDNHNGIRFEAAVGCRAYNCEIYDIGDSLGANHNTASIMLYDTSDSIIEHCELYGAGTGSGIYVKGDHDADGFPQQNNTIRFNIIRDIASPGKGIVLLASQGTTRIHQNIFRGLQYAISINSLDSSVRGHPIDNIIANNVFYDNDHAIIFEGGTTFAEGCLFYNNITHTSTVYAVAAEDAANPNDWDAEHNCYFSSATFAFFGSNMTFTQWKTNFGEDAVSPASITTDPQFVSAGTDFHLQGGSPCHDLGRVVGSIGGSDGATIDAGCYITGSEVIGIAA